MKNKTTKSSSIINYSPEQHLALTRRIRASDDAAFEQLIQVSQRVLYALIWRMLRNHDDTNDIIQDAFIKLYEHRRSIRRNRPVFPYLQKIAINLSINRLQARKRVNVLENEDFDHIVAASTHEAESEQAEALAIAARAVELLPHEQKIVMRLRVQEEMSYQEIADVLKLRVGTVMSRLARARQKIVVFFSEEHKVQKERI